MELRRAILWGVFIVSLLMVYDVWESIHGRQTIVSSFLRPDESAPPKSKTTPSGNAVSPTTSATTPAALPQSSAPLVGETISVNTDLMKVSFDSVGATIKHVELLKHRDALDAKKNLVLLDDSKDLIYRVKTGLVSEKDGNLPNHTVIYKLISDGSELSLKPVKDTLEIVWEAETPVAKLRKTFVFSRGKYTIAVKHEVINLSNQSISPVLYLQLERDGSTPAGDSKFYSTFFGPVVYTDEAKYKKISLDDIAKNKEGRHPLKTKDGWIGIVQHYFVSSWILPEGTSREVYTDKKDELYRVGNKVALGDIATQKSVAFSSKLYIGPQDQDELAKLSKNLDLVVDYGWLAFIAKPVFMFMQWLYSLLGNWGWTIVALTLVIKLLFFPLAAAGYKSTAKLKKLDPKLKAIQEKYPNDPMRAHREKAELFRAEKISPLGGCLPMLLQFPVFMALYWVLQASVEMRYAPWFGSWITNLAAPDPWYILPAIYMITMLIQMKLSPTPADPMQAKVMMAMPFIFGIMFFFFPAGLVLYWVVGNIFSLIQQGVINNRLIKAGLK